MGVGADAGKVEALAVVLDLHRHIGGVSVHRDLDLAGLGVLADVGQRLLHQAVDGQFGGFGQFHGFEDGLHLDAAALGEFAGQDFQRGRQPQVRQRGGAQVFHDPALERNPAVERLRHVFDAVGDLGVAHVDARLQAGHVQFGGRQQGAQLVVQLAGQVAAFVFTHLLQVVGQFGEGGGAFAHQVFQA